MKNKFIIEEISNLQEWESFVINTPQYTMFVSNLYLSVFGGKYKLLFIRKGIEIKAGFCILLSEDEKNIILNDLIVYSGIFFKDDSSQKHVKARSERFDITNAILDYITINYNKIHWALSVQIEDMRPFLWYNYGKEHDRFELDLRYTSYLDISSLSSFKYEEQTQLFKSLDTVRQRNIRKARENESYTIQELNIDSYIQFYQELMSQQNESISSNKLDNKRNIIKELVSNNKAIMFITKNKDQKILYITIFSFDKNRAYYLFGAGNINANEQYKGTICFWDAFITLSQKYNVKEVDLEGINSPQRGWFKLSFSGTMKTYYEIKRVNHEYL